jgi:hypothetical protein
MTPAGTGPIRLILAELFQTRRLPWWTIGEGQGVLEDYSVALCTLCYRTTVDYSTSFRRELKDCGQAEREER